MHAQNSAAARRTRTPPAIALSKARAARGGAVEPHRRALRLAAALAPLLLAGAVAGCDSRAHSSAPQAAAQKPGPIVVQMRPAQRTQRPLLVPIVGTLHPAEEALISTEVAGLLRRSHVDVGAVVRPGEPLAQVDTTDYEIAVAQAEASLAEVLARLGVQSVPGDDFPLDQVSTVRRAAAQLENARFTYERIASLKDTVSNQEVNDVSARLRVAEAEWRLAVDEAAASVALARERQALLEAARERLADATTRTPPIPSTLDSSPGAAWLVAARLITEGQFVDAAAPLYRLIIASPLKLRSKVPERYAAVVAVGQPVELRTVGGVGTAGGRIARISPAIDPVSRTFEIEALIDNPESRLMPGAFATGSIRARPLNPPIIVPSGAIVTSGGVPRLFVVEDGVARRREVRFGERTAEEVEIVEGLEEGATFITRVVPGLAEGVPVIAAQQEP